MAAKALPSPDELRKLLDYDPETGVLTWRARTAGMFSNSGNGSEANAAGWNARWAWKPALSAVNNHGYRHGKIFACDHLAHRVAWALHYGEWPAEQIDHINGDRSDNRIANLRQASRTDNARNQKLHSTSQTGFAGVRWNGKAGKWRAEIRASGMSKHLGFFTDFAAACDARKAAERELGFHENHGRTA